MNSSLPNDAKLFQALHEAIKVQSLRERRGGERHRYQHPLLVASTSNPEQLPDQSEFHHVLCNDLSLQGFACTSADPLELPYLVVALGRVPFTFTLAHIIRREIIELPEGPEFSLGCQFIRRLN